MVKMVGGGHKAGGAAAVESTSLEAVCDDPALLGLLAPVSYTHLTLPTIYSV